MSEHKDRGGPPPEMLNAPTKQEALEKIFKVWDPVSFTEMVPLQHALDRILAEDLRSMCNLPVVRASAMDGVAIAYDSIRDGIPDTTKWRMGKEFVRADTGDDFPDQYDTVIQIEQVTLLPKGGLRFAEGIQIRQGQLVRPSGHNLRMGKLLVRQGTRLGVLDLAALGSGGYSRVNVVRRPVVSFLPTGSELIPIGTTLHRGQNYDTNSLVAQAMLEEMGAQPNLRPLIPDDYAILKDQILELCQYSDLVIVNAGTSKGSEDYCPHVLEEIGEILFHGVRAVPGRPMCAALCNNTLVLNLSGPSLAAFYGLEWAVKPLVGRLLGVKPVARETVSAVLARPLNAPGFLSSCVKVQLFPDGQGGYRAVPMSRPHGKEETAVYDPDTPETCEGVYFTQYGEQSHQEGEPIQVQLIRKQPL